MVKLLLVGPSDTIKNYDLDYFQTARKLGYVICCYSGAITHFRNIGFHPDYYTFIDPGTVIMFDEWEWFKNGDGIENINLLTYNLYTDDLKKFFDRGLSCNTAREKWPERFQHFKSIMINNKFKNDYKYDVINFMNPYNNIQDNIMEFNNTFLISGQGKNVDKFVGCMLPLVLSHFTSDSGTNDISEIKCLGFGDFVHKQRITKYKDNISDGSEFEEYWGTFKKLFPKYKQYFKHTNIDFNFEYENQFSNTFEPTKNNIKPLKRKKKR